MSEDKPPNSMWGGRFSGAPGELMQAINVSIGFDRRLATHDIRGSRVHAAMLADQGIISPADGAEIQRGLGLVEQEILAGSFPFRPEFEDIHLNIEARLTELIGEPAGRLHIARSRNDQVALDLRLWVRDACDRTIGLVRDLQRAMLRRAEETADAPMPGFTHLQPAQPVTFGHHLLAYVEMLGRDEGRFADARTRLNESPLGAAALAGTRFPIDRHMTASALKFDRPMANSLDAVSARDFLLETLAAAGICSLHLSRLAEEIVLWVAPNFGFIKLSDAFTTGSSIMPQKRNPDAAELVRAKSGRILAAFHGLAVVLKGLPLAYSKDLQEDKEPVFDAFDTLEICLRALAGLIADMQIDRDRLEAQAGAGFATATDLADWLVAEAALPFREAHRIAGTVVKQAEARGIALSQLHPSELTTVTPQFESFDPAQLSATASVESRASFGGTAPNQVREQIRVWKERLR